MHPLFAFAFALPPFVLALLALVAPHLVGLLLLALAGAFAWIAVREAQIKNAKARHLALVLTTALKVGADKVAEAVTPLLGQGGSLPTGAQVAASAQAAALKWLLGGGAISELRTDYGLTDEQLEEALGVKLAEKPEIVTSHPVLKEIVALPDAKPGDGSPTTVVRMKGS